MAKKDTIESHSPTIAAMQSEAEESKNKDSNSTGKDNDNITSHSQEGQQSNQKSKRKRRKKKSGKSKSLTSGTETLPSAEDVEPKLDPSVKESVLQCKSAIESGASELIDSTYDRNKPKEINHSNSGDDLKEYSPKAEIGPDYRGEIKTVRPLPFDIAISPDNTSTTVESVGSVQISANLLQNKVIEKEKQQDNVKSYHRDLSVRNYSQNYFSAHPPDTQTNVKGAKIEIENTAATSKQFASLYGDLIVEKKIDEISGIGTGETKLFGSTDYDERLLSNNIHVKVSGNDNKKGYSLKPFILVIDKSTQTDPVQECPSSPEKLENMNISTMNSNSGCNIMAEESGATIPPDASNSETVSEDIDNHTSLSTEGESKQSIENFESINISTLISDSEGNVMAEKLSTKFPPDASNLKTVSEEIDNHTNLSTEGESLQSIKNFESINISTLISDSEENVMAEGSGTTFSSDASNLDTVSEEIDNHTNLSTEGESKQSIKEDFLRDVIIASEKFMENFMKCFKDMK